MNNPPTTIAIIGCGNIAGPYTQDIARHPHLRLKGVTDIDRIRVSLDTACRIEMVQRTGRRTVPQIFIGETHVGGSDDIHDLDRRGQLDPMLEPA